MFDELRELVRMTAFTETSTLIAFAPCTCLSSRSSNPGTLRRCYPSRNFTVPHKRLSPWSLHGSDEDTNRCVFGKRKSAIQSRPAYHVLPLASLVRGAALSLFSLLLPTIAATAATEVSSKPFWLDAAFLAAGPGLFIFNTVMVFRIVLTWYPQAASRKPWIFLVVPTEPLLQATRKVVKPMGGVDVSPIVWFAIGSFLREILIGPQGILNLIQGKLV